MTGIKMKVVKNERIVPVDIDDTLVMHQNYDNIAFPKSIRDPYEDCKYVEVWPNLPMIKIMKEEHKRGSFVIVWSKGGFAWAEAVIKALQLEEYVDMIMSKPFVYLDDKDVGEWLKDRVYLKPTTIYKNSP